MFVPPSPPHTPFPFSCTLPKGRVAHLSRQVLSPSITLPSLTLPPLFFPGTSEDKAASYFKCSPNQTLTIPTLYIRSDCGCSPLIRSLGSLLHHFNPGRTLRLPLSLSLPLPYYHSGHIATSLPRSVVSPPTKLLIQDHRIKIQFFSKIIGQDQSKNSQGTGEEGKDSALVKKTSTFRGKRHTRTTSNASVASSRSTVSASTIASRFKFGGNGSGKFSSITGSPNNSTPSSKRNSVDSSKSLNLERGKGPMEKGKVEKSNSIKTKDKEMKEGKVKEEKGKKKTSEPLDPGNTKVKESEEKGKKKEKRRSLEITSKGSQGTSAFKDSVSTGKKMHGRTSLLGASFRDTNSSSKTSSISTQVEDKKVKDPAPHPSPKSPVKEFHGPSSPSEKEKTKGPASGLIRATGSIRRSFLPKRRATLSTDFSLSMKSSKGHVSSPSMSSLSIPSAPAEESLSTPSSLPMGKGKTPSVISIPSSPTQAISSTPKSPTRSISNHRRSSDVSTIVTVHKAKPIPKSDPLLDRLHAIPECKPMVSESMDPSFLPSAPSKVAAFFSTMASVAASTGASFKGSSTQSSSKSPAPTETLDMQALANLCMTIRQQRRRTGQDLCSRQKRLVYDIKTLDELIGRSLSTATATRQRSMDARKALESKVMSVKALVDQTHKHTHALLTSMHAVLSLLPDTHLHPTSLASEFPKLAKAYRRFEPRPSKPLPSSPHSLNLGLPRDVADSPRPVAALELRQRHRISVTLTLDTVTVSSPGGGTGLLSGPILGKAYPAAASGNESSPSSFPSSSSSGSGTNPAKPWSSSLSGTGYSDATSRLRKLMGGAESLSTSSSPTSSPPASPAQGPVKYGTTYGSLPSRSSTPAVEPSIPRNGRSPWSLRAFLSPSSLRGFPGRRNSQPSNQLSHDQSQDQQQSAKDDHDNEEEEEQEEEEEEEGREVNGSNETSPSILPSPSPSLLPGPATLVDEPKEGDDDMDEEEQDKLDRSPSPLKPIPSSPITQVPQKDGTKETEEFLGASKFLTSSYSMTQTMLEESRKVPWSMPVSKDLHVGDRVGFKGRRRYSTRPGTSIHRAGPPRIPPILSLAPSSRPGMGEVGALATMIQKRIRAHQGGINGSSKVKGEGETNVPSPPPSFDGLFSEEEEGEEEEVIESSVKRRGRRVKSSRGNVGMRKSMRRSIIMARRDSDASISTMSSSISSLSSNSRPASPAPKPLVSQVYGSGEGPSGAIEKRRITQVRLPRPLSDTTMHRGSGVRGGIKDRSSSPRRVVKSALRINPPQIPSPSGPSPLSPTSP
ncbi:MAG: hypothetical protein DHS80DRAFT_21479 [Piptocephalis tieghemiana]|nr:MAG: hypothetical protein DHS80DRAFT_21479 [Piptocephalis tieghemiana]